MLKLRHRRPLDLQVGVAPGQAVRRVFVDLVAGAGAGVGGAEIDAADDGQLSVHHQDLAMVPRVGGIAAGHRVDRVEGVVLHHSDAFAGQSAEEDVGRVDRAVGIIDHIDLHALMPLGRQKIAQRQIVDLDVLQNEIFEIDMVPGGADRLEHGAEGVGAVLQHAGPVAGQQRRFGHRLLDRQVTLQQVLAVGAELGEQRLALLVGQRPAGAHDHRLGDRRIVRHLRHLGAGGQQHGDRKLQAQDENTAQRSVSPWSVLDGWNIGSA